MIADAELFTDGMLFQSSCRKPNNDKTLNKNKNTLTAVTRVNIGKMLGGAIVSQYLDKGMVRCSGGASAVKEPGHFEVRKSSS